MAKIPECLPPLQRAGIDASDCWALRRIAMQLHRWHELECGTEYGAVERDETTGKVNWYCQRTGRRSPTKDMETPALKRLARIMARYPSLAHYVQGDPRGASLYILRPGDVPAGEDVGAYYSRGLAVYK
jgi:hypothetical protein